MLHQRDPKFVWAGSQVNAVDADCELYGGDVSFGSGVVLEDLAVRDFHFIDDCEEGIVEDGGEGDDDHNRKNPSKEGLVAGLPLGPKQRLCGEHVHAQHEVVAECAESHQTRIYCRLREITYKSSRVLIRANLEQFWGDQMGDINMGRDQTHKFDSTD